MSASEKLRWLRIRRFSSVEFLVVLVLWIVSASFLFQLRNGDVIESLIATLVLSSAVLTVGGHRRTLVAAILLAMPIVACRWLNHLRPDLMPPEVHATGAIVFMVFVAMHLFRFVLRSQRVNTEVLCAAISVYLMLGIIWTMSYVLLAQFVPGSFVFSAAQDPNRAMVGFEALYFSLGTLSGVSYGDITPVSNVARMLALLEAMTGVFYMTILIARLVSLYAAKEPSDAAPG